MVRVSAFLLFNHMHIGSVKLLKGSVLGGREMQERDHLSNMHVSYSGQNTKDGAGERDISRRESKQFV